MWPLHQQHLMSFSTHTKTDFSGIGRDLCWGVWRCLGSWSSGPAIDWGIADVVSRWAVVPDSREASVLWSWELCPGSSSAVFWVDVWLSLQWASRVLCSVGAAGGLDLDVLSTCFWLLGRWPYSLITEHGSYGTFAVCIECARTPIYSPSCMLAMQLLCRPVVSGHLYPRLCSMCLLLVLFFFSLLLFCFFSLFVCLQVFLVALRLDSPQRPRDVFCLVSCDMNHLICDDNYTTRLFTLCCVFNPVSKLVVCV